MYGRVVDENNTPVPNVRISVRGERSVSTLLTTTSDARGAFAFEVAAGSYLLTAECQGFFAIRDKTLEVSTAGELVEIVLPRLQQTSESINVSGNVSAVDSQDTTSERHITGRQLIDVPYPATRDFRNALRIMPGVLRHPSGRLSFDGGMENQVFYTLNGFNISDPITGRFTTRMPVESVRSVDYASGRYSPEFGKGSAGALAIQTTNGGDKFRYSATNFVPGIETQKGLHIGTWSPRLNFSGPIRRGKAWFSDSVDTEYSVAVVPDLPKGQDRTARWRGSNMLHTQINLTPSQILSVDVLAGLEYAPRTGLSALDPVSTSVNRNGRQYFGSVKDQMYFGRGVVLDAGYAHTETSLREQPVGWRPYVITPNGRSGNYFVHMRQRSRRDQFLVNLFAPSFQAAGAHQLKTGIDLDVVHYSQAAFRTAYENYDRAGRLISRTTFGGPGSATLRNFQASSYVVDVWRVRSGLTFEYGVRQDWDELVRRVIFSPRVAISYAPFGSGNTKVAAGYAVIHDATTISMFVRALDQYSITTTFQPSGELLHEPTISRFDADGRHYAPRYRNLSAGIEHRLGPRLRFSASALRRRGSRGLTYAAATGASGLESIYELTNLRRDIYDSASFTLHQTFGADYGWMVNYIRSRALSNAVLDLSIDQPLQVVNNNFGRLSLDAPHRLLSWGYLPTWRKNWAWAYLLDARSGFPFSVVRDNGEVVGPVNSRRFPVNFALNLHAERKFRLGRYRFAIRAGLNNVTNAWNASGVNNVIDSPSFLRYNGREGRHGVFRLRWLKQGE